MPEDLPIGSASAADLLRTIQKVAELAGSVQRLIETADKIADVLTVTVRRLDTLEERFREHGHVGNGLGSCWDGT